jgi:hypothetical protein
MSATATDYTYAIYIWQSFSFGEKHIGPTYVMCCICICIIELNFEEQIENKLEVNSNRKTVTRNATPNSTGRNFLKRDQNSTFYPPLERIQNSLGFWYSRFPQILFLGGLKVQSCPDS